MAKVKVKEEIKICVEEFFHLRISEFVAKLGIFSFPANVFTAFFLLNGKNVKEYLILITFRNRKGCGFCIVRSSLVLCC